MTQIIRILQKLSDYPEEISTDLTKSDVHKALLILSTIYLVNIDIYSIKFTMKTYINHNKFIYLNLK